MFNITIGTRNYRSSLPFEEAFHFESEQNYCFDLQNNMACLQLEGARAFDLLQGQLTCDIRQVTATQMRTGGLCNLKGRLLALMDVIQDNPHWYMIMPADLLSLTQAAMMPFAMVSRCQLKPTGFKILGLFIQNSETLPNCLTCPAEVQGVWMSQDLIIYRINAELAVLIVKNDERIEPVLDAFRANNTLRETLAWHYLKLKHQHVEIYPATRGLFLPHRLDLHKTNIISFDKGCYKGQEIIARIHYKSTIKHTLRFFEYHTHEPIEPGTILHDQASGETIGELIDITPTAKTGIFGVAATTAISSHDE